MTDRYITRNQLCMVFLFFILFAISFVMDANMISDSVIAMLCKILFSMLSIVYVLLLIICLRLLN